MKLKIVALVTGTVLVASACGGDEGTGSAGSGQAAPGIGGLGHAATADEADRSIEVELLDSLAFDPPGIEVSAGETITFVITNTGKAHHEFVIGDEGGQVKHAEHMMGEGDMAMTHDEPNAVSVPPGETKELTWAFTDPGTTVYGCHVPGHYDGGMKGEITVTE